MCDSVFSLLYLLPCVCTLGTGTSGSSVIFKLPWLLKARAVCLSAVSDERDKVPTARPHLCWEVTCHDSDCTGRCLANRAVKA